MIDNLSEKTLVELEQLVLEMGQKKYLAGYIFNFIHARNIKDISDITVAGKLFRNRLAEQGYYIGLLTLEKKLIDKDGTIKYVFESGSRDRCIETVLLRDGRRRTVCISTQLGCAMGCSFCATARLGFKRNLSVGEIVGQVSAVETAEGKITNIVYMGMGEPFLNYNAVLKSLTILNHPRGKNIGIRHITISTCGIVPAIRKFAEQSLQPRLAVSLNAPSDELRTQLMPINAKYPIAELLDALRFYQARTGRRITFEYVMLKGFNDTNSHARKLIGLLNGFSCNVNLIEHNPYPGCKYKGSSSERINSFASILDKGGIETTTRFRMGRDINAACGQLGSTQPRGMMDERR
jgi:23S rRNA (adenine2503-C2)-methyltransferase